MTEQLAFLRTDTPPFRPIHYLGCKLRVLPVLHDVVEQVDPGRGRLLDLFSGTGVVAAHFARSRPVAAADVQEYARVLAQALLTPTAPGPGEIRTVLDAADKHRSKLCGPGLTALIDYEQACLDRLAEDAESFCAVVEEGSLLRYELEGGAVDSRLAAALARAVGEVPEAADHVLTRHYGGVYFSYDQALALDGLAWAARRLSSPSREVALAAVMSTASDLVSSVGNQFAQPLRPRDKSGRPKLGALTAAGRRRAISARATFIEWLGRYAALPAPGEKGEAFRADFREILDDPPDDVAVVYADPPYTRDHYSRYYHVLETIALGDEPGVSLMRVGTETRMSRGLYRADRHQSPFCIKSQAPEAFSDLLRGVHRLNAPLVLSYSPHGEGSASRPRLMEIEHLVRLAETFFGRVQVVAAGRLMHSKFNAARLNADPSYDAELLIVCTP